MKKVLHISKYYSPFVGGVEQIARDCVLALQGKVDQKIICFDHIKGHKDSTALVDNVEVIRCAQEVLVASQAMGRSYSGQLKRVIKEYDPDIVVFHYPNPFVSHFLLQCLPKKTKLIVWWHLDIYKQKVLKYFFYHQNRRLLTRANKVIATSPNYIEGSPWLLSVRDKCVVIPNCIDENRLQVTDEIKKRAEDIRKSDEGKIICLAVGRHVPYKGFEYLIKASKLLDDRFDIRITGKGPLTEELHELAKGDDKVHFLGLVSDEDLKANLIACDIFTFSSITKNEAFGVALAEGMYFGHPTVTFTIPGSGVNYVSIDGETGIEVENRNVKKYAAAIKKIADDKALREKYGAAAKERIIKNFMFSAFVDNVNSMIQQM